MTATRIWAFLFVFLFTTGSALAGGVERDMRCPNANILGAGLFNKVCWSCMFPVKLFGRTVFRGDTSAPDKSATKTICVCGGDLKKGIPPRIGITLGMWQPTRIVELVRRPYCFPAMGGAQMGGDMYNMGGETHTGYQQQATQGVSSKRMDLFNIHYYVFQLFALLELLDMPGCGPKAFASFDVMFLGEAFPNWYDDKLSFLVQPESVVFSNPIAKVALPIDCIAASTNEPIDKLHWAIGCWGSVYPFTGNVNVSAHTINNSSLVGVRAMALMARLQLMQRTMGNDAACEAQKMPILVKSQYKMQMMFPVPESKSLGSYANVPPPQTDPNQPPEDNTNGGTQVPVVDPKSLPNINKHCCHNIGETDLKWGTWRSRPATGEDQVYLLWQWVDCCLGASF
ncbi:TraU family protein [Thiolapillus sp.]|uniref:TraU family protein n=6 Tax=Thiolapillus sp. TaxID=2017437 RepID=UPI0025E5ED84|nr:TraU family protein [Thiolapillus sp.]